MIDLDQVPLPPSPRNANDVVPPAVNPSVIFQDLDLKDVIATPLYAYVQRSESNWENYDRRNMRLSGKGDWTNRLAAKVTPQTPIERTATVQQGITSSLQQKEDFARSIGVSVELNSPTAKFGTNISATLTSSTDRGFEIANSSEVSTKFTVSTEAKEAVIWLWQLDVAYLLSGDLVTWAVRSKKGIGQLTGKDSRAVLTRDGEGRERTNQQQVSGAKRVGQTRFSAPLAVNQAIFVYTAFPSPESVNVTMEAVSGEKIAVMSYTDLVGEVARLREANREAEAA